MKRREFLKRSLGIAALMPALGRSADPTPGTVAAKAARRVTLGNTGIEVSRLAIGTGSTGVGGSSNQTRQLGLNGLADLLEEGLEMGLNFWDSADQYGSHPHLAEGMRRVGREKVVVLTKTTSKTAEGVKADLDRFRQELGTDMIDIVLLHCLTNPKWTEECAGAMDVLSEAKARGTIRAHGVSCHSFGALETAAASDWVEVDLARINPAGAVMDADPSKVVPVLEQMQQSGKGVIGMKIFGAGQLTDRMDECLRYVMRLNCVHAFTIGMESRRELREVVSHIEKV